MSQQWEPSYKPHVPLWVDLALLVMILLLLGVILAHCQEIPQSSAAVVPQKSATVPAGIVRPSLPPTLHSEQPLAPPQSSKKFWYLVAYDWAAAGADVGSTVRATNGTHCREANPLLGNHPSAGRASAVMFGYTGTITTLSLLVRKDNPGSRLAWISHGIVGSAHAGFAAANARCF
jgi:hypothetical protein